MAKLQRWRFGRRLEKPSPDQLRLWEEALETEIAAVESELEAVLVESASVTEAAGILPEENTTPVTRHRGCMTLSPSLPRGQWVTTVSTTTAFGRDPATTESSRKLCRDRDGTTVRKQETYSERRRVTRR